MSARPEVFSTETYEVVETDWGRLVWMVSAELGNSDTMTFGRCVIDPGKENPRHYHPDCDEVLHVVEGVVEHTLGYDRVVLHACDGVSIPAGVVHNARNLGDVPAVMVIAFSSARRETVPA